MATYKITDPQSGKVMRVTGDSPPTEQELQQIFSKVSGRPNLQAQQPQPLSGPVLSPMGQLVSDVSIPQDQRAAQAARMGQMARRVAPAARMGAEMGGMIGGAVLGTAAMPVLGTVAGGGLGYAAGKQFADLVEERAGLRESPALGRRFAQAALDVPTGVAMEATGGVIGKVAQAGLASLGRYAPKLYRGILKGIPAKYRGQRTEQAVKTALEEKIPPTGKGMLKLSDKIKETNKKIANVLEDINGPSTIRSEYVIPKTGEPFKFSYIRNKSKSTQLGKRFAQDIEPAGKYVNVGDPKFIKNIPNMETGTMEFKKPLILDFGGEYGKANNWKNVLSGMFGNKQGKALANAIKQKGYDGIVTIDKSRGVPYTSEVVSLKPETSEISIKTKDVLKRIDSVKTWAKEGLTRPKEALKEIAKYEDDILKQKGEFITPQKAQKLKQEIYKILTDKAYTGEVKVLENKLEKQFARGLKEELVNKFPQLKNLNARDSALISLKNVIEKTSQRVRSAAASVSDIGTGMLGDKIGGGKGIVAAVTLNKLLQIPAIKANLAFALAKAGKKTVGKIGPRLAPYLGGKIAESQGVPEKVAGKVMGALATEAGADPIDAQGNSANMATQAYLDSDYPAAVALFKKAINEDPENAKQYVTAINQIKREMQGLKKLQKKKRLPPEEQAALNRSDLYFNFSNDSMAQLGRAIDEFNR